MESNKRKIAHILGFAAFIGILSLILQIGSQDEIQTIASYLWPYGFWFTVVTIFLIRSYIGSIEITEIEPRSKKMDQRSVMSMFDTSSSLLVELATVYWIFASFIAVGFGATTDIYRQIHPFEQFASYVVIPYLGIFTHLSLKSMKKEKNRVEITPIGISIRDNKISKLFYTSTV